MMAKGRHQYIQTEILNDIETNMKIPVNCKNTKFSTILFEDILR